MKRRYPDGALVRLVLPGDSDNGRVGRVLRYDRHDGRYVVSLTPGQGGLGGHYLLQRNLRPVPAPTAAEAVPWLLAELEG